MVTVIFSGLQHACASEKSETWWAIHYYYWEDLAMIMQHIRTTTSVSQFAALQLVMVVFKTSILLCHFYCIIFAKSEHFIEDSSSKNLCGT